MGEQRQPQGSSGIEQMGKIKTWNDDPVVRVRNNDVDLALKLLRERMQNVDVFKHLGKRQKKSPARLRRRYKGPRAERKRGSSRLKS